MEVAVRHVFGAIMVVLIVSAGWTGACAADSGQKPAQKDESSPDSISEQFKIGLQHIGDGAQHVGEGIKQGAIHAWEAVKAGASAASEKLHETRGPPKPGQPAGSGDASR
jgi:hypothetical protein